MDAPRGIGTFVVWDYVVFAAMLLISAAIGIYYAFAGGGQQTSKDFLMGGRRMTAVPVALSLTASFMSAVTVLGTPSEVYRFGAIFSIFAITYFFVVAISAEVFLPVFYKLGITSTYEVKGGGALGRKRGRAFQDLGGIFLGAGSPPYPNLSLSRSLTSPALPFGGEVPSEGEGILGLTLRSSVKKRGFQSKRNDLD